MFKKETLQAVRLPAFLLFAATVLCALAFGYANGIGIVFLVIQQMVALLTAYLFVIRPQRAHVHIWVNYFIWFLLNNLGAIASALGLQA